MSELSTSQSPIKEPFSVSSASFLESGAWSEVAASKGKFLQTRDSSVISPIVRPMIAGSWARSLNTGVNPGDQLLSIRISDEEYNSIEERYRALKEATESFLNLIEKHDFPTKYCFELMTRKGVSLVYCGNLDRRPYIFDKSLLNESTMGTNAHSLCMRHKVPVQVVGPEHYCTALSHLVTIAAPILNNDDIVVASLVLTQVLPGEPQTKNYQKFLSQLTTLLHNMASTVEVHAKQNDPIGSAKDEPLNEKVAVSPLLDPEDSLIAPGGGALKRRIVHSFEDILGASPAILSAIETAKRFAATDENILIHGKSGTGKELFAEAIHDESPYDGPFIAIKCDAISADLIEKKTYRSPTGSSKMQLEMIPAASRPKATLFLNEINDMEMESQKKLLHLITGEGALLFGPERYTLRDLRIIATTNRDLMESVERGTFREDLLYRLTKLLLYVPTLEERGDDPLFYAEYFLEECQQKHGVGPSSISSKALDLIRTYHWPGNVRQLKNAIFSAYCTAKTGSIEEEDLPFIATQTKKKSSSREVSSSILSTIDETKLEQLALPEIEEAAIKLALLHTKGDVPSAADILQIDKSTLYRKIEERQIDLHISPN